MSSAFQSTAVGQSVVKAHIVNTVQHSKALPLFKIKLTSSNMQKMAVHFGTSLYMKTVRCHIEYGPLRSQHDSRYEYGHVPDMYQSYYLVMSFPVKHIASATTFRYAPTGIPTGDTAMKSSTTRSTSQDQHSTRYALSPRYRPVAAQ